MKSPEILTYIKRCNREQLRALSEAIRARHREITDDDPNVYLIRRVYNGAETWRCLIPNVGRAYYPKDSPHLHVFLTRLGAEEYVAFDRSLQVRGELTVVAEPKEFHRDRLPGITEA